MVVLNATYFGSVDWYRQIACAKDDVVYIEAHEHYVKQTERNRCTIATANGTQHLTVPITLASPPNSPSSSSNSPSSSSNSPSSSSNSPSSSSNSPSSSSMFLPVCPAECTKAHPGKCPITEVFISDHGNWRHNHWEALKSAYGMSPFFDFYQDDIHPFFEDRWDKLFDFNMAIATKMLNLIGINKTLLPTSTYQEDSCKEGLCKEGPCKEGLYKEGPCKEGLCKEGLCKEGLCKEGLCKEGYQESPHKEFPYTDSPVVDGSAVNRPYYQTFQRRHGFIPHLSILDLLFNEGPASITILTCQ